MRQQLLEKASYSRILLALDGVTPLEAAKYANELAPLVAGGKATDLIDQMGAGALDELPFSLKFLDPKINDIENTVKNRLYHYEGADIVTVHASMSESALVSAAAVGKELGIAVIAVTVLTNIDDTESHAIFGTPAATTVERLVMRAQAAGLAGLVCSAQEAILVRTIFPDALIITPGVRSAGANTNDQARIATPAQAIKNGADFVVIGRQILSKESSNLRQAEVLKINDEIARVLE